METRRQREERRKNTNGTNQKIARIIRDIRPFVSPRFNRGLFSFEPLNSPSSQSAARHRSLRVSIVPCLMFFLLAGCSTTGQSIDALLASANSQLSSAQKAGAEQLAKSDFEEAETLLTEAETALKSGDKKARSLIQKAHARARLAEALARQLRAENEAAQLEAELEKAREEATRARLERRAAEDELGNVF